MGELANCPKCNALFISGVRNVCDKCYQEELEALQAVQRFLKPRNNRSATLLQVIGATGVKEELLFKFIREKRINLADLPNLAYPCNQCGAEIREGKLCSSCKGELLEGIYTQDQIDQVAARNQVKENDGSATYFSINKK